MKTQCKNPVGRAGKKLSMGCLRIESPVCMKCGGEVEEDARNAILTTRRQRMATQRTDRILGVPETVIRFAS